MNEPIYLHLFELILHLRRFTTLHPYFFTNPSFDPVNWPDYYFKTYCPAFHRFFNISFYFWLVSFMLTRFISLIAALVFLVTMSFLFKFTHFNAALLNSNRLSSIMHHFITGFRLIISSIFAMILISYCWQIHLHRTTLQVTVNLPYFKNLFN